MRAVVQRVKHARVSVGEQTVGEIGAGLLVLLGIAPTDTEAEVVWMAGKIAGLRIFADEAGLMNRSVRDIGGEILVVSQFTLYGDVAKGRRPSFGKAARPEVAEPLYERAVALLSAQHGQFGADMQVALVNDGPVTLIVETPRPDTSPVNSP